MNAPLIKQLSSEEFRRLSLDQRIAYMRALMSDLRKNLDETKREIDRVKKMLRDAGSSDGPLEGG